MQRMIGTMKVTAIIAVSLAVAMAAIKQTRADLVVLNRTSTIMNTCWNAAGLSALLILYVRWAWRVIASRLAKKYWSDRRWKAVLVRHPRLRQQRCSIQIPQDKHIPCYHVY